MRAKSDRKNVVRFIRDTIADPFEGIARLTSNLYSLWLVHTYPFASIGGNFYAHYRVDLARPAARYISFGNDITVDKDVWFNIPVGALSDHGPVLVLEDGCKFSRRCIISAKNNVHIGPNCMFGPSVFITDHNHAYQDVTVPISDQGVTEGGKIQIEEGCWIGFGAAVICEKGDLVIGRKSIIGANSLVSRSIPPYSVAIGHPARVVKQYDFSMRRWVMGTAASRRAE